MYFLFYLKVIKAHIFKLLKKILTVPLCVNILKLLKIILKYRYTDDRF